MIRVLSLSGDPRSIGQQHGEQVADLRPQIQASMQARLSGLYQQGVDLAPYINKITRVWEQYASETLEMLMGMAEALDIEWGEYITYTIASYLNDCLKQTRISEGCTTWAAGVKFTRDGAPILAKNRDYHPDHRSLQCLARVQPAGGHPYLCLTSAGSPGVFSSGINEAGLAVADTYVSSNDIGPGIARYSLMMNLLEKFSHVQETISYLYTRPHSGAGTITLVDAQGDMAVFEIAHSLQVVRQSDDGFAISTNHFAAPEMRSHWIDNEPPHLQGNSLERSNHVEDALRSARGQVDIPWSQTLMAKHGTILSSICRHSEIDSCSMTVSSTIFLPRQASLYVANGLPCQTPFELFRVID
jgi:isopenicillin-N N-acyltransferase like protein